MNDGRSITSENLFQVGMKSVDKRRVVMISHIVIRIRLVCAGKYFNTPSSIVDMIQTRAVSTPNDLAVNEVPSDDF